MKSSSKAIVPSYTIGQFINEPASKTQCEITDFATMQEPEIEDIHKHLFYEVLWTDAGTSKHTIDYREYVLTPRTLFFISPGQIHYFEEWHKLKGGSILFTEDFFLLNQQRSDTLFEVSFLDNFYANPCLHLSKRDFTDIRYTIDLLQREKKRADASEVIQQALLHILIAQVQRCVDADSEEATLSKKYTVLYN
jgi:AraC family transcriptional regulator, transcriptional activator of pobA